MAKGTKTFAILTALTALVALSCQPGICDTPTSSNQSASSVSPVIADVPPFSQTETQEMPGDRAPEDTTPRDTTPGAASPNGSAEHTQVFPSPSPTPTPSLSPAPSSESKSEVLEKAEQVPQINDDEGIDEIAGDPDFEAKVHDLNCKILSKEIAFAKFNVRFRQEANVQGRWRGLRYFLSQETSVVMTAAGLLGQVVARERSIANTTRTINNKTGQVVAKPRPLNRRAIETALATQMIGQQIGSLGALTELGINYYHSQQAKKHGFDRATALKKAAAMRQELKALLSEREQLVESVLMMPTQREVLRLEGEVLRDICNLTFDEYRHFHINIARFRTVQNSLYVGDFLKCSVGWPGNLLGILGQANRNPTLAGPNGICVATSGAMIALNPIVSRGLGKLMEYQTRKKLNREFGNTERQDLDDFEKDTKLLRNALLRHRQYGNAPMLACEDRMELYETEDLCRKKAFELGLEEIRAGQRTATQNVASAQIVGQTKIANGVGLMVAGFRYPRNTRASFPVTVDGQIAYLAGSWFGAADNIRIQVQAEAARRRLKRQRLLPGQVFGDRLKALDELEKRVNSPL